MNDHHRHSFQSNQMQVEAITKSNDLIFSFNRMNARRKKARKTERKKDRMEGKKEEGW